MSHLNVFSKAIINLRRGGWLSLGSILGLAITFVILSEFTIIGYGLNTAIRYLETRPQVTVFFEDAVTEEEILGLKEVLEERWQLASAAYVSKEQAMAIYAEENQDEPLLLEALTPQIFPASLEVRAQAVEDLAPIAGFLQERSGVEEVVYYADVADSFRSWRDLVRLIAISLGILLGFNALLATFGAVGDSIRRAGPEIKVMRLIGASSGFVRNPFVVQGALSGLLAAVVSTFLAAVSYRLLWIRLRPFVHELPLAVSPLTLTGLVALKLGLGAILGSLGSLWAVRRYLRR